MDFIRKLKLETLGWITFRILWNDFWQLGQWQSHGLIKFVLVVFLHFLLLLILPFKGTTHHFMLKPIGTFASVNVNGIFIFVSIWCSLVMICKVKRFSRGSVEGWTDRQTLPSTLSPSFVVDNDCYLRYESAHTFVLMELHMLSDREICRTCPADFCWCPAGSSDLAGHFVRQSSIHIKCPTRKTRMTNDICQSSTGENVWQRLKMSGRALRACRTFCPAHPK